MTSRVNMAGPLITAKDKKPEQKPDPDTYCLPNKDSPLLESFARSDELFPILAGQM